MDIIVISKDAFNCTEYDNIKNIAFSETQFTITKSDNSTVAFNKADYLLSIKW